MFDWQTIIVLLIILGAGLYALRRVTSRLGSFCTRAQEDADNPSCAAGCAGCGLNKKQAPATARNAFRN